MSTTEDLSKTLASCQRAAANISEKIRSALHDALPAPPDQFLHVMIPGKVINFAVSLIEPVYFQV